MRVAADDDGRTFARVDQLDHAVRAIAQPHGQPHVEQALQPWAQQFGRRIGGFTRGDSAYRSQRVDAERLQDLRHEHAARLGGRAVHQDGQPAAREQQGEQRCQHRQLARAVVAGQDDQRLVAGGNPIEPRVGGVDESRHLLGRLALDAHGQAERADLEVGNRAIEYLAEEICRLLARKRSGALLAPADLFQVLADAHAPIVSDAS
jgi:hypothetical protein